MLILAPYLDQKTSLAREEIPKLRQRGFFPGAPER